MKYIQSRANPSGAYPAPMSSPFPGAVEITDEQAALLVEYAGFVTVENGEVIPNTEAWESVKAGPPIPVAADLRENAYNTQAIIEWGGGLLTVTQAAQKWQYYAAEGDYEKTDELTGKIAAAKQTIREQYPDAE